MKPGMFLAGFWLATLGMAQSKEPISTDRPDFTEGATVVPLRSIQLETGFTYQWSRPEFSFSGPEALLRYGAGPRTEFRLGIPDINWQRAGGQSSNGFGDIYIATKLQMGPLKNGDDFALIPAVNLPSRDTNFSSRSVDPELKVCWGRDLKHGWGVSAMAYGLYTTDAQGRLFVFQQTISFDHDLSERLAMFTEYAGTFSARTDPDHVAHIGFLYLLSPDVQIDIHGGVSMNGSDHKPFLAAGYSVRY